MIEAVNSSTLRLSSSRPSGTWGWKSLLWEDSRPAKSEIASLRAVGLGEETTSENSTLITVQVDYYGKEVIYIQYDGTTATALEPDTAILEYGKVGVNQCLLGKRKYIELQNVRLFVVDRSGSQEIRQEIVGYGSSATAKVSSSGLYSCIVYFSTADSQNNQYFYVSYDERNLQYSLKQIQMDLNDTQPSFWVETNEIIWSVFQRGLRAFYKKGEDGSLHTTKNYDADIISLLVANNTYLIDALPLVRPDGNSSSQVNITSPKVEENLTLHYHLLSISSAHIICEPSPNFTGPVTVTLKTPQTKLVLSLLPPTSVKTSNGDSEETRSGDDKSGLNKTILAIFGVAMIVLVVLLWKLANFISNSKSGAVRKVQAEMEGLRPPPQAPSVEPLGQKSPIRNQGRDMTNQSSRSPADRVGSIKSFDFEYSTRKQGDTMRMAEPQLAHASVSNVKDDELQVSYAEEEDEEQPEVADNNQDELYSKSAAAIPTKKKVFIETQEDEDPPKN